MSELMSSIFEYFREHHQYMLSTDMVVRAHELAAIDELESRGLIKIQARAIGFIVTETV